MRIWTPVSQVLSLYHNGSTVGIKVSHLPIPIGREVKEGACHSKTYSWFFFPLRKISSEKILWVKNVIIAHIGCKMWRNSHWGEIDIPVLKCSLDSQPKPFLMLQALVSTDWKEIVFKRPFFKMEVREHEAFPADYLAAKLNTVRVSILHARMLN